MLLGKRVGPFRFLKVAQDPTEEELAGPTEEEMVDEWEKGPYANIDEYYQLIIRKLKTKYGKPVKLLNPELDVEIGSPEVGFNIVGFLQWPEGRPLEIAEEFGESPIVFEAYVTSDGTLLDEIFLDFG
jgi:hypothetical protein